MLVYFWYIFVYLLYIFVFANSTPTMGLERRWTYTAEAICSSIQAKFPGLHVVQLELSLHAPGRHRTDVNDAPFIGLIRSLRAAGVGGSKASYSSVQQCYVVSIHFN